MSNTVYNVYIQGRVIATYGSEDDANLVMQVALVRLTFLGLDNTGCYVFTNTTNWDTERDLQILEEARKWQENNAGLFP